MRIPDNTASQFFAAFKGVRRADNPDIAVAAMPEDHGLVIHAFGKDGKDIITLSCKHDYNHVVHHIRQKGGKVAGVYIVDRWVYGMVGKALVTDQATTRRDLMLGIFRMGNFDADLTPERVPIVELIMASSESPAEGLEEWFLQRKDDEVDLIKDDIFPNLHLIARFYAPADVVDKWRSALQGVFDVQEAMEDRVAKGLTNAVVGIGFSVVELHLADGLEIGHGPIRPEVYFEGSRRHRETAGSSSR